MELPPLAKELSRKIAAKACVGGVIGLGYVGLPLARHLCGAGYRVLGFDVDPEKTERINRGESYIKHIDSGWIGAAVTNGSFSATTAFKRLAETDCISICVPTPLDEHLEPNLQYVRATAESIAKTLRPGQLVLLESTTYPGTTTEILLRLFENTGLKAGEDFFLAYSPEREDPANPEFSISNIPKVLGGVTPACAELAAQYYATIFKRIVRASSPEVAELSKLLENIFRSVNIALVNELKLLCTRMGLDVWEIIDAAATKPFGFMPFYPGPGLGGHCIPIDPFYLSWKAREYGMATRFIELAGQINTLMPEYVVHRVMEALNAHGKPLKGARVLILGAAYKKDVDDMRESPALKLMELLLEHGAEIAYNDPHIPQLPATRKYQFEMSSTPLTAETLERVDCVLVATDHSVYDYEFIVRHAPLVVDTRNATRAVATGREKIVKA
ncbi:MAG TPA: nucleotide sugar dehydrogenase [Candidatus Hydrogenedentes bacterium]|jgi:UDP-N-acetyl-D-glucosamine dehydrogenase|nr:nucleotide sugar dehydrogenase [Candidatus Hydrogenedentota bacterium]